MEGQKKKPNKNPKTPLRFKNKNKTGSRTQYTDVVQIIPTPGSALASLTHHKPPRGKKKKPDGGEKNNINEIIIIIITKKKSLCCSVGVLCVCATASGCRLRCRALPGALERPLHMGGAGWWRRVAPVTLPHRGMWSTWGRHGGPGAYGAASAASGSGASLGRSMHGSLEWLTRRVGVLGGTRRGGRGLLLHRAGCRGLWGSQLLLSTSINPSAERGCGGEKGKRGGESVLLPEDAPGWCGCP